MIPSRPNTTVSLTDWSGIALSTAAVIAMASLGRATWDALNLAVVDADGEPFPTPHFLYVDDDIYADVFNVERMEQCIACSIEAMYLVMG